MEITYLFLSFIKNLSQKKIALQGTADLGILSFMKESTSFGFSAPQSALENGEFNYQNEALESPFGYKYFDFKYLGNKSKFEDGASFTL